ncbi:cytoplasmic phosphatidylinositol transfer protein 1 [Ischnura elegans]|uniref:cytoplasmic phosphatidylinositol transfer protein 1 n=1 Tax=Ischnura elegans TaxID=197161 RepID=UPI001ED87959|nr:cytoplasmic phosphatidylinositol transfer protein 1 [Ischnura elegans]
MVLNKEYRICMPLTVEEYKIGQLYMIARHSHEQSDSGEGVEVVENCACEDPEHGKGQYTEKRVHLSSRLPYWLQSLIPKLFYVTEKAWNYYPFTITEYTCSFIPKFHISIRTKYEDNNGSSDNVLGVPASELKDLSVDFVDIVYDEVNPRNYKEEEDLRYFKSVTTGRGPLVEGWRGGPHSGVLSEGNAWLEPTVLPIMCSYKLVSVSFEVWGLQTRVEEFVQRCVRDVLLLGHRQAFAWVDEWIGMDLSAVRAYEAEMIGKTNEKVAQGKAKPETEGEKAAEQKGVEGDVGGEEKLPLDHTGDEVGVGAAILSSNEGGESAAITSPSTPRNKSWFSWS